MTTQREMNIKYQVKQALGSLTVKSLPDPALPFTTTPITIFLIKKLGLVIYWVIFKVIWSQFAFLRFYLECLLVEVSIILQIIRKIQFFVSAHIIG